MRIAVNRKKWKFWRHPMGGKNPLGYYCLNDIEPIHGRSVVINGTIWMYILDYSGILRWRVPNDSELKWFESQRKWAGSDQLCEDMDDET